MRRQTEQRFATCPICRAEVKSRPVQNLGLQHLAEILAEAVGARDKSRDRDLRERRTKALEGTRADINTHGHLFPVLEFGQQAALEDSEDGVARCPNCMWEMEGSTCAHCGQVARLATIHTLLLDEDEDDEDDEDYHAPDNDEYSDDGGFVDQRDTDEILADEADFRRYDDDSLGDLSASDFDEQDDLRARVATVLDVDSDSDAGIHVHADNDAIMALDHASDYTSDDDDEDDDEIEVVHQGNRPSRRMAVDVSTDNESDSGVEEIGPTAPAETVRRPRPRIIDDDDDE